MGQSSSNIKSHNSYEKLQKELSDLITNFQPWTNKEICDQMVIVYKDRLAHLSPNDIMNLSVSIGIKHPDQPENKEELCSMIVNHYLSRIGLLNEIILEMRKCYENIMACIKGPICLNVNDIVTDIIECQKYKGIWIEKNTYTNIIENLKRTNQHDIWLKYVNNLDLVWGKYIKKILHVINLIKNKKETSNDNIFEEIRSYTHDVLRKMKYVTKIYCLIVTNFGKM